MKRDARALVLLFLLVAVAFTGRSVVSSDGADVVSETLGLFVQGHFGLAQIPGEAWAIGSAETSPFRSRYGLFSSLLPLPFLAAAWPFRGVLGATVLDASVAATWAIGAALAALAFLRLARALRPEASSFWAPAFLAGTFLWPYAADSYTEPWAAASLAFGASAAIGSPERRPVLAALGFVGAALLRPILWLTAPVLVLAFALPDDSRAPRARASILVVATLVVCLASALAVNAIHSGAFVGTYGDVTFAFSTPLLEGLWGLLVSPGRGLVFYAPLVVVAVAGWRRLDRRSAIVLLVVPAVAVLAVARWFAWHGASSWGPRLVLPVVPLLAAPAVLVGGRAARLAVVLGALLNVGGVLVAPGAFMSWVESWRPPAGESWPAPGNIRVSEKAALSPLLGHPWLLLDAAGLDLPRPWGRTGARETPPPPPAGFVSPLWLRRSAGLPLLTPMIPRLLVRNAWGFAARGEPSSAALWAREALRLDPRDPDAKALLGAR